MIYLRSPQSPIHMIDNTIQIIIERKKPNHFCLYASGTNPQSPATKLRKAMQGYSENGRDMSDRVGE